jgi:hypothetical protein
LPRNTRRADDPVATVLPALARLAASLSPAVQIAGCRLEARRDGWWLVLVTGGGPAPASATLRDPTYRIVARRCADLTEDALLLALTEAVAGAVERAGAGCAAFAAPVRRRASPRWRGVDEW